MKLKLGNKIHYQSKIMLKMHVNVVAINKVSYFVSKCLIRPICLKDILLYDCIRRLLHRVTEKCFKFIYNINETIILSLLSIITS